MSVDYPLERNLVITDDRSLRRERFFPESSSADQANTRDDSNDEESKIIHPDSCLPRDGLTYFVDYLRDLFLVFPRLEQTLSGHLRGADLESCLKASGFQFKKKRFVFLQLLNSGPQNTKDPQHAKNLRADLTRRSVGDAVLDEEGFLKTLQIFRKDDKAIVSRIPGSYKSLSGEGGLWEGAKQRANSISDSQFHLGLKNIPIGHYLHDAAIDVEKTAYDLLTKQVDTSVSFICQQIVLAQKQKRERQVQREVGSEEAREAQILWSKFVRQVKDVTTRRASSMSTSYVPYGPMVSEIG